MRDPPPAFDRVGLVCTLGDLHPLRADSATFVEDARLADTLEREHPGPFGEGRRARVKQADVEAEPSALLHGEPVVAEMEHQARLSGIEDGDRS